MNNKWIGHIIKVYFNKIVFEVSDLENLRYNYLGNFYIGRGLNDFITIYGDLNNKFIYQVVGLYEQEKPYLEIEESKFKEIAYFEAIPIGEIIGDKFEYGLSKFPMISEDVFLTSTEDLEKIFNSDSDFVISLGTLSINDYLPKISINKLFTTHFSILGNTGSGKSTTIRKLLSELLLLEKRNVDINKMNFIIFDIHNEYKVFPDKYVNYVSISDIAIPAKNLSVDDWINLVQPSSAVQLPVLLNGLRMASILNVDSVNSTWIRAYCALELYNNQQTDAVTKRAKILGLLEKVDSSEIASTITSYDARFGNFSNDSEEYEFKESIKNFIKKITGYEYEQCQEELMKLLTDTEIEVHSIIDLWTGVELIILMEEAKGNAQIRSYCSTLMTRIENIINTYSNSIFDESSEKIGKFDDIMRFQKGFTIFDCSSLEDSELLFLSGFFLKQIFSRQKESRNSGSVTKAFHFILDEAHRYISEDNDDNVTRSLKIFERIAKEGRKFGLFLIVSSQRPGELSKTVLSQCNNFILHRIRNNIDLEQIRKSIPYINDLLIYRLSYLKTGNALAVGEAFAIPMEIEVQGEEYSKQSATVKLDCLWLKSLNENNSKTSIQSFKDFSF